MKYLAVLAILAALLVGCGGSQAKLVGTEGSVSVTRDIATYQQLRVIDLGSAAGTDQLRTFLETGALYSVPVETRVEVLETTDDYFKVRIIGGDHADAVGYVSSFSVEK